MTALLLTANATLYGPGNPRARSWTWTWGGGKVDAATSCVRRKRSCKKRGDRGTASLVRARRLGGVVGLLHVVCREAAERELAGAGSSCAQRRLAIQWSVEAGNPVERGAHELSRSLSLSLSPSLAPVGKDPALFGAFFLDRGLKKRFPQIKPSSRDRPSEGCCQSSRRRRQCVRHGRILHLLGGKLEKSARGKVAFPQRLAGKKVAQTCSFSQVAEGWASCCMRWRLGAGA